jgi:hypothetical protein
MHGPLNVKIIFLEFTFVLQDQIFDSLFRANVVIGVFFGRDFV